MTGIEVTEELARDWDWYACDQVGSIAHFTTAGLRRLPCSVKLNLDDLERIARYLCEDRQAWSDYTVRVGVEKDAGGWKDAVARDHYLSSFTHAARRGLFSYNTEMRRGSKANYYLVARPDKPLRTSDLPPEIGMLLSKTRALVTFAIRDYISEAETLEW